jgi:hypothetical protein
MSVANDITSSKELRESGLSRITKTYQRILNTYMILDNQRQSIHQYPAMSFPCTSIPASIRAATRRVYHHTMLF